MNTDSELSTSETSHFEDERWTRFTQPAEFRHTVASRSVTDGTVLDVGCGDGLLLSMLKAKNVQASGIDISPVAVRTCQERGLDAQLFVQGERFPFPEKSFDTVILLDVLEHTLEPAYLLREAVRVARGRVIVSVPNFVSLPARIQVMRGMVPENNTPHKGHVYWFTWEVLETLATEAGLRRIACSMNTIGLLRRIPYVEKLACAWLPGLFALSFVAEYRVDTGT